jgi:DNA-binding CsgD family transcriptional regulator
MLDWFDRDGRRYFIVRRRPEPTGDFMGLTPRERDVVSRVALGESGKLVGYRFGISQARVSAALRSAMKKLLVRTAAQLVLQVRCFSD